MSFHFSPENTKVLLVGTTQYNSPEFAPITPAIGNIYELRKIFQNKDIIGLPNRNISALINPNIEELIKSLKRLKTDPNIDTFIFYYVGHGYIMWFNGKNRWFMTAKDSVADMNDYEYVKRYSLEYDVFKDYVESIGQKRIVIFDACYSGQATQSANVMNNDIKGTFTISSASADEQSLFNPADDYTYFTKEFINIFKNGIKNNKEFLSINDIYEELYERIEKNPNLPKPTQKNNFSHKFNFAKNLVFIQELKAKQEADRKEKEEAELKAKKEKELKAKQEAERKVKEEVELKAKQEADRKAKEEVELKAKQEADRKAKKETVLNNYNFSTNNSEKNKVTNLFRKKYIALILFALVSSIFIWKYPRVNKDKEAFINASNKNTINSYKNYLDKNPTGDFVSITNKRLDSLERIKEKTFFDSCSIIGNYELYLNNYPKGMYVSEVKEQIIKQEKEMYNNCITIKDYNNFIIKYPKSKLVENSRIEINKRKESENKGEIYWINSKKGYFIDKRDGKDYKVVKIFNQIWMAENLAYKPKVGNYWVYWNEISNFKKYGYLYDWKTSLNVCPSGWSLPTKHDFDILLSKVSDKDLYKGGESGFNDICAGRKEPGNGQYYFNYNDIWGFYWTSSSINNSHAWSLTTDYRVNEDDEDKNSMRRRFKNYGFSIRCIKK